MRASIQYGCLARSFLYGMIRADYNPYMHALIENNRRAIAELCRRHRVHRLEVFGSLLRDDFDARDSDVDLIVEFEQDAAHSFENYLALKESLEHLFERSVDLIEPRTIRNRRLRHYIEQSKSSVYDAA